MVGKRSHMRGRKKERFTCFKYILIYLVSPFKIFSQGANFADVIQMTDIFEGSIIRSARRLDEFLNQVHECPPSRKQPRVSSFTMILPKTCILQIGPFLFKRWKRASKCG